MNAGLKIFIIMIVCFAMVLPISCKKRTYPEFFKGRYPNFGPGPEGGADRVYIKKGVDFSVYTKVMLNVLFFFDSGAKYNAVHPDVVNDLRDAFRDSFAEALGDAYPLVDEPYPDVLRVRVAITNVVPLRPVTVASSQTGTGRGNKQGRYASVGGASMQAEVLDSWSNERVGAVIDTKTVEKYHAAGSIDEWENTREAFNFWAQRLRKFLDEAHGL
jgi:hypothetical protein